MLKEVSNMRSTCVPIRVRISLSWWVWAALIIMWLIGFLATYLVLLKLSTADLGLPISLLGPQDKIHYLIDKARAHGESFNKTLQDLDAISVPIRGSNFVPVRRQWYHAMVNLVWIQNYTLANLTKAIDDQTSGFRQVLDSLYSTIHSSKQQVEANRALIDSFYEWRGGLRNIQLLNDTRTALGDGLDHLRDALKTLDDVISKAQRETPLTDSTVEKVVTPGMTMAVWSAVDKILRSIKPLEPLTNDLLKASKLVGQDIDQTRNEISKMVDRKHVEKLINATRVATIKFQATSAKLVQNLNQTIWTAYKPLVKNSFIMAAQTIDEFLKNFTQNMMDLNTSVTQQAQNVFEYTFHSIPALQKSVEERIEWASDLITLQVFTDANYYSHAENCLQNYPLVNETLGRVFHLDEICLWNQLPYLQNLVKMIEEFIQTISAAAMAPLTDLQTCNSSKLDQNLCLRTFVTTHMLNPNGTTSNRTLVAAINRLTMQAQTVVEKEFMKVQFRFENCAKNYVAFESMDELLRKSGDCLGIEF